MTRYDRIGKQYGRHRVADKRIVQQLESALDVRSGGDLADIGAGFREARRVLRAGGVLGVLDFGMPRIPILAPLYRFYFRKILPRVGKFVSGVEGPYGYLPDSVQAFPPAEELREIAKCAGFGDVDCKMLTGGIAVLLTGKAD